MEALITNIQGYSIHDGPGIRTVVFLKGCPLKCEWCANPENIPFDRQTGFIENLCIGCGKCAAVCPNGAINTQASIPNGSAGEPLHRVDYSRCTGCGICSDNCAYGALVSYGKLMSAREVFELVRRDKMFFEDGGGVTLSGGEPMAQAGFAAELFTLCKNDGISTCLETSGFVDPAKFEMVIPLTDYILFDIKLINSEKHRHYTGRDNTQILSNARMAAQSGADILFRVPLIPTVNDGDETIRDIADFVKSIASSPCVQLMPYHRMGDSKYNALNIPNTMRGLEAVLMQQTEDVMRKYISFGVECSISR